MSPEELYQVYAAWTGQLHTWLANLGRHIDCEYFPSSYEFKLYSGAARAVGTRFTVIEEQVVPISTVPNLSRPRGEKSATIQLPRPEDNPTRAELDQVFKALCLAAAQVLEIDLGKARLGGYDEPPPQPLQKPQRGRKRRTIRASPAPKRLSEAPDRSSSLGRGREPASDP